MGIADGCMLFMLQLVLLAGGVRTGGELACGLFAFGIGGFVSTTWVLVVGDSRSVSLQQLSTSVVMAISVKIEKLLLIIFLRNNYTNVNELF